MAIVQNPITGRTKKAFGSAVFSKQFGKNTMRTKPLEVKNPKTLKQKMQRAKFSLMVVLSRMTLKFIRVGFKQIAIEMSAFNAFMKNNISTAISGVYPAYTINYANLIFAKGTLTGADTPTAIAAAGKIINVDWVDNSGEGDAEATDTALILMINATKKKVMADTTTKTRLDETFQKVVPADWVGDDVHVYISFMTATGIKVADSTYISVVTILA
jgi:hypothetical protein